MLVTPFFLETSVSIQFNFFKFSDSFQMIRNIFVSKMTEIVPRWIIYWCVHIQSQGILNVSKSRQMMLLCMVAICNVVFTFHSFFCDVFVWKCGPRPRISSRCYHGNNSAATFKKGIFVYPPWVPNCMQNLNGGWNISNSRDTNSLNMNIVTTPTSTPHSNRV